MNAVSAYSSDKSNDDAKHDTDDKHIMQNQMINEHAILNILDHNTDDRNNNDNTNI